MMPPEETGKSFSEESDQTYGRYEGNHTSSTYQHYEQAAQERSASKVYPQPSDNKNILRFALAVISLVMLLACGFLFVVLVGGTAGWISFAAASLAIFIIAAVGIDKIH